MKGVILRRSLAGVCLLGCGFVVSAQEAAKHAITFDDMIRLHRISEAHVSPDGKWAAFTVSTPDMDANRGASNIWVAPTAGGTAMQLTQSGHDTSPVWPPDGKTLGRYRARFASVALPSRPRSASPKCCSRRGSPPCPASTR